MASWRKRVKRLGRSIAKVHSKVAKVARPVATAAGGVLFGPAGAAAVAALSHYPQQYSAATAARAKGYKGHTARTMGRSAAQRTTKYSVIAGGAGVVTAGVIGGLGAAGFGLVGQSALGVGSGAGLFGLSNPLMPAPATALSAATSVAAAGGLTSLGAQTYDSLYQKGGAQPVEGGSYAWEDLFEGIGGGMGAGGGGDEGSDGSYPIGSLNANGGGQGGGGLSTGAMIALGIGAALLLSA